MKRIIIILLLFLTFLSTTDSRVDKVDQGNGTVEETFKSGTRTLTGITFDGTYYWLASSSSDKIYKVLFTE